jgi:hypothetical protein
MEILISPYLESYAPTESSEGFIFADDFPGTGEEAAPQLVEQVEDLVVRYLTDPDHPEWPKKWAKVYDQTGLDRYLVSVIHVASNQEAVTDQEFAAGFDRVAGEVFDRTGVRIGFALDILPPDSYAPGNFKATPALTGPWLARQESMLAIQCFLPEIWTGMSDENALIAWKRDYLVSWMDTGIPLVHDLTPGYDAHIVFPASPVYGNNRSWRDLQSGLISELGNKSLSFNSWNGYTEGMAAVPTLQYGDSTYTWLREQFEGSKPSSDEVRNSGSRQSQLEVLPNPATHFVEIRLSNPAEKILFYEIRACNGIILEARNPSSQGYPGTSIRVPLDHLAPGVYILRARTRGSIYTGKILKQGGGRP